MQIRGIAWHSRTPALAGLEANLLATPSVSVVAIGFAAHAVTDVMHRPGMLPSDLAPQWYFVGSACLDAVVGALCYLPLLKR